MLKYMLTYKIRNSFVSVDTYIFIDVVKVFLRSLIFGLSLWNPRLGGNQRVLQSFKKMTLFVVQMKQACLFIF